MDSIPIHEGIDFVHSNGVSTPQRQIDECIESRSCSEMILTGIHRKFDNE